jgi:hypothetical protein
MKKSEIEGWAGLIGALLVISAVLIPAYQAVLWLKHGAWTPIPVRMVFQWLNVDADAYVNEMSWEGAKSIVLWIMALPLWVGLVALATAQFFVLECLSNHVGSASPADQQSQQR